MKTKIISAYPCSQSELYLASELGWNNYQQFQSDFQDFNSNYTSNTFIEAMAGIDSARAILTESQRNALATTAHQHFIDSADVVCKDFQKLKLYILKAYEKNIQPSMLINAGIEYYEKAATNNIAALNSLINAATNFIATNTTALETDGGMPTTYPTKFGVACTTCTQLGTAYETLELQKGKLAEDKVVANNTVYHTLITMLQDGHRIFEHDIARRKQFAFINIIKSIRGTQPARLRGKVLDINGQPIADARIYSENAPFDLTTNNKGRYLIPRIAAGTYYFIIDRPGYIAQEIEIKIRPGIYNTMNATLEASQQLQKVA